MDAGFHIRTTHQVPQLSYFCKFAWTKWSCLQRKKTDQTQTLITSHQRNFRRETVSVCVCVYIMRKEILLYSTRVSVWCQWTQQTSWPALAVHTSCPMSRSGPWLVCRVSQHWWRLVSEQGGPLRYLWLSGTTWRGKSTLELVRSFQHSEVGVPRCALHFQTKFEINLPNFKGPSPTFVGLFLKRKTQGAFFGRQICVGEGHHLSQLTWQ